MNKNWLGGGVSCEALQNKAAKTFKVRLDRGLSNLT